VIADNAGNDKPASDRLRHVLSSNCTGMHGVGVAEGAVQENVIDWVPNEIRRRFVCRPYRAVSKIYVYLGLKPQA
jgi:hypothetical protein